MREVPPSGRSRSASPGERCTTRSRRRTCSSRRSRSRCSSSSAFAGGLSQLQHLPGFDFAPGYTAFQFVFVLLQAAAFGGVFTGFGIARDFEYGFARRLLIAAPYRSAIVVGYGLAAFARWVVIASLPDRGRVRGGHERRWAGVDLVGLYGLAADPERSAALLLVGGASRHGCRTMQAVGGGDADARLPRALLRAGLRAARSALRLDPRRRAANPVTYLLEAGRGFVSADPVYAGLSFGLALGLAAVMWVWAFGGMRRAAAAGVSDQPRSRPCVDRGDETGDDAARASRSSLSRRIRRESGRRRRPARAHRASAARGTVQEPSETPPATASPKSCPMETPSATAVSASLATAPSARTAAARRGPRRRARCRHLREAPDLGDRPVEVGLRRGSDVGGEVAGDGTVFSP